MGDRRAEIENRMLTGEPFTYGQLCQTWGDEDRLIDRTIQRLRKAGKIEWYRYGGMITWRTT